MAVKINKRYITFIKASKIMEREYERCKKYRVDFLPENYDQELTCWDCGILKNRRLFPYRKQYKFNKEKRCKLCNNSKVLRRTDTTLKQILQKCLKTSIQSAKNRSKKGREDAGVNTLTLEQLIKMYKEQKGKCKLSGETLSLQINSPYIISIDRIDSSKGYTIENIQLITKIANQAKSDLDSLTFRRLINNLYKNINIKEDKNLDYTSILTEKDLKIEKYKKLNNILNEKILSLRKLVNEYKKTQTENKKKCLDCNILICNKSTRCNTCNNKFIFKKNIKNRPSYDQLLKDREELKYYTKIGHKYNVSDNAVRKWFKNYEKYENL